MPSLFGFFSAGSLPDGWLKRLRTNPADWGNIPPAAAMEQNSLVTMRWDDTRHMTWAGNGYFWHGRVLLEGFHWFKCLDVGGERRGVGDGGGGGVHGVVGGWLTGPVQIASGPFWVPASRRMMINQRWLELAWDQVRLRIEADYPLLS